MLKPLFHKLRESKSEDSTKTIKIFVSGSIAAVVRTSQMQNSSSGEHCSSDHASKREILWYEREVEGQYEMQDAQRQDTDRVVDGKATFPGCRC